jgi:hypothetical protein
MSFTTDDFHTLVRIIEDHPEWRADLRRLLLSEELLLLPEQFAQFRAQTESQFQELRGAITRLVEAQQRTEARIESLAEAQQRTEARIESLAEAQQRTEARIESLAEAQQRTEARIESLAEAQQRTEAQIATLVEVVQKLETDVGTLKGWGLEQDYRNKPYAYFHRVITRPRVLTSDELAALVDNAVEAGVLTDAQAHEILLADIVVRGKRGKGGPDVYLVVEVSWGVGVNDVDRAVQRAALLSQLGTPVIPVVAGRWVNPDAAQFAQQSRVWQLRNGSVVPPALATDA